MPKKIAPSQGLPYGWIRGEDHWGGPMSDSQIFVDTFIFPVLQSLTFAAPPPDAKNGYSYVVAPNPTGAWTSHAGDVATYVENAWVFHTPKTGWRAYAKSYGKFVWFNGTTWLDEVSGDDPVNPNPDPSLKPKWYDIGVTVSDTMHKNEPILHLPIMDPMMLPADMTGSSFDMADGASQAYYQFRVQRNGTNVGTMTVEVGGFAATMTTAGGRPVSFAAGDRITIRAQDVPVAAMKNFGFVIRLAIM